LSLPGEPGPPPPSPEPAPRPGLRTFTLEGRAAPGLFVVGWLATIMGGAILFVALQPPVPQAARLALTFVGLGLLSVGLVSGAGSQAIERRARGERYTGPSPFLVFAAALPLSFLLVALLALPAIALGLDPGGPAAALLSLVLQGIVYVGLIRLLVVGTGALRWSDMGLGRRPLSVVVEDVSWGIVLAVPILIATSLLAAALTSFLPVPDSPLPPSGGGAGFVLNLLAAAVAAPIGEEMFFRGYATTAWSRTMPIGWAIVRGAVFFAAVHVITVGGATFSDAAGRAMVGFITRLPIALGVGLLFTRRRSLFASISLHATFNGLIVVLAEVATRG
jgi:membrane protease YdiL (CAAX protease family)